jgi:macrolide transport system ATP-binding/permease protein
LLGTATATENVELPAIYAGRDKAERMERAQALLERMGLGSRSEHKPGQLSGGQQQRVSIARALMNDAEVILADEPTGALDRKSGAEMLALLKELHAQGRTIILITHDAGVAQHAERVIQISDGKIVEDSGFKASSGGVSIAHVNHRQLHWLPQFMEAAKMALRSLRTNLFRSALTLLGVVIGVGAVVTMLAIGNGSKAEVLTKIQSMGTNLLLVFPGAPGVRPTGANATLVPADALAVRELKNVTYVSPQRRTSSTLRFGGIDYRTQVTGIWPDYMKTQDWKLASGTFITQDDVDSYTAVVVLGKTVATNLFPDGSDPVGKFVLIGNVQFEVIGTLAPKGANAFGQDMDDAALVPLSTGFIRLFGKQYLDSLNVKIDSADQADATETAITNLLTERHGTQDFQVRSTTSLMETVSSTQNALTLLLGAVAAISLLVGGIGVMNIMLVSVTERTREIGMRMATGARRANILIQFNTEALVVCGIGGVIGVVMGVGAGLLAKGLGASVVFTLAPAILAFTSALATGLLFGYLPARKAASMDPVVALAAE